MNEYEVFIEDINSCGGEQYAKKELIEVEADSPESYVKENGRFPIIDISKNIFKVRQISGRHRNKIRCLIVNKYT